MKLLRLYLHGKQLNVAQANMFLRLVFVVVFMGQLVLAMLTGLLLRLAAGGTAAAPNSVLGWVLVLISLLNLPLVLFLSSRGVRAGDRQAALTGTLLAAVLLSTPAWFLSLALITRQELLHLVLLLGLLLLQYGIGMFLALRFARLALSAAKEPQAAAEAEPEGADGSAAAQLTAGVNEQ